MKKTILILLAAFYSLSVSAQTEVTFTVNTANISVGDNGMYLGGGIFNSAIAHEMSDDDGDGTYEVCLLYTSPSPRDQRGSRMPSSA